jgi:proteasome lid subunit RPN8/RPN11
MKKEKDEKERKEDEKEKENINDMSSTCITQMEMNSLPQFFKPHSSNSSNSTLNAFTYLKIRNHILKHKQLTTLSQIKRSLKGKYPSSIISQIYNSLVSLRLVTTTTTSNTLKKKSKYAIVDSSSLLELVPIQNNTNNTHVHVMDWCMAAVDLHSHFYPDTEVIGLLGGSFTLSSSDSQTRLIIDVKSVYPCHQSQLLHSTGVNCELEPLEELQAHEYFSSSGLRVVGWYHSHPTFAPLPSKQDLRTQLSYQRLFHCNSSNVEPFVGLIMSPYYNNYSSSNNSENEKSVEKKQNSCFEFVHLIHDNYGEVIAYRPVIEIVESKDSFRNEYEHIVGNVMTQIDSPQNVLDKVWENGISIKEKLRHSLIQWSQNVSF